MRSRGADLIPVVQKSYDLCAGLYTHVNQFPRAQRGLLGRVIDYVYQLVRKGCHG